MKPSSVPDLVPVPPLALAEAPTDATEPAVTTDVAAVASPPSPPSGDDEAARRDADLRAVAEIARAHHELLAEI
jgi:hypothetical protein